MTAASKSAAFSELSARLNTRSLELYDEAQLVAELRRLRTRSTAGSASVVNPRVGGSHGARVRPGSGQADARCKRPCRIHQRAFQSR
jgi:hypothetical protein